MKLPSTKFIEHLKEQLADERLQHEKQLADDRAAHTLERDRILAENKRLQDEVERLRLTLGQPSRAAEPAPEPPKPADPDEMPTFRGTPWQQVQQKEMWLQTDKGKAWMARQVATLKVQPSGEIAVMANKEA